MQRKWAKYRNTPAHVDGEPASRRRRHVDRALAQLSAAGAVNHTKVQMVCEVQVVTEVTAQMRSEMHELFKVYRAKTKVALQADFEVRAAVSPPQNPAQMLGWAARFGDLDEVERCLSDPETDVDEDFGQGKGTALLCAAGGGHSDVVDRLLRAGSDPTKANLNGGAGDFPLLIAAERGHLAVTRVLLGSERCDVHQTRNDGFSPLMMAAQNGFRDVVEALLGSEAIDPNVQIPAGGTALILAAQCGHAGVVERMLRDTRVDATIAAAQNGNVTAAHIAAATGDLVVVRLLANAVPAVLGLQSRFGTVHDLAVKQHGADSEVARAIGALSI